MYSRDYFNNNASWVYPKRVIFIVDQVAILLGVMDYEHCLLGRDRKGNQTDMDFQLKMECLKWS